MSNESDTTGKTISQGDVKRRRRIDPRYIGDNVLRELQSGRVMQLLMVQGKDGLTLRDASGASVPVLDGLDWLVIGIPRTPGVLPRFASVPIGESSPQTSTSEHELVSAETTRPGDQIEAPK